MHTILRMHTWKTNPHRVGSHASCPRGFWDRAVRLGFLMIQGFFYGFNNINLMHLCT